MTNAPVEEALLVPVTSTTSVWLPDTSPVVLYIAPEEAGRLGA